MFRAGLPDFSLYNIPKMGKIYQMAIKTPNGRNIFQMSIEYTFFIPTKINPNLDFWFENVPSGNPGTSVISPQTIGRYRKLIFIALSLTQKQFINILNGAPDLVARQ
jgi:hypothetical protein